MRCMSLFLLFLIFLLTSMATGRPLPEPTVIKAGYYESWTSSNLPPSSIRFSYFTHILYAFVQIDPSTHILTITPNDSALITSLTDASHCQNPPVKVLLSIGGGNSNASAFAAMAAHPTSRAIFIASSIAVARSFNLDGLDLDWEFPATPDEMCKFGELIVEWRQAIEAESAACGQPALLLTAAVYFASHLYLGEQPKRSYPVAAMAASLDWVNAMCFDYHGAGWEPTKTGAHAALFDRFGKPGNLSTSYGIGSWLADGMPKEKLVMGIPQYGRTWKLNNSAEHGIGAPAMGPGDTGGVGIISFRDIVAMFKSSKNSNNGTTVAATVYDKVMVAAYSYKGYFWVSYDDRRSLTTKVKYGRKLGIRGYFFWALDLDDKKWSLSHTASRTWRTKSIYH